MHMIMSRTAKLRGRSLGYILRGVCLTIWPLYHLMRLYYRVRFCTGVYSMLNKRSQIVFGSETPVLDAVEDKAVKALETHGIYITSIEQLLPQVDFSRVQTEVAHLLKTPLLQEQIQSRQSRFGDKWYVIRGFGSLKTYELPASFAELFLHQKILNIANSYTGLFCRLNYADMWHNLATNPDERSISSEYWHRDHEDWRMIKIFIYLSHVTHESGPFHYLRGSHSKGEYRSVLAPPPGIGDDHYPSEESLWQQIPKGRQIVCTGQAGTIVICDASGLHKGGRALTIPRTVLVGVYASNAAILATHYLLPLSVDQASMSNAMRFAMRLPAVSPSP